MVLIDVNHVLTPAKRACQKATNTCPVGPRFVALHRHDVAGFSFLIEIQLDLTGFELTQHGLDTPFDRRMVRAVAGDEFLDNRSQRQGRQLPVRDTHVGYLSARIDNRTILSVCKPTATTPNSIFNCLCLAGRNNCDGSPSVPNARLFNPAPNSKTDFLEAWLFSGVCNAIDGQLQSQGLVVCDSQSPVECYGRRWGYG